MYMPEATWNHNPPGKDLHGINFYDINLHSEEEPME